MGYKREAKIYKLKFTDDDMNGLEVRARSLNLGQFMEMLEMVTLDEGKLTATDMQRIGDIFRGFASALVSWNLEDEDPRGGTIPVPATLEGIYSQDMDFIMRIIAAWMEAISSVHPDLGKDLSSGSSSPVPSMPMETLSPNQSS